MKFKIGRALRLWHLKICALFGLETLYTGHQLLLASSLVVGAVRVWYTHVKEELPDEQCVVVFNGKGSSAPKFS